MSAAATYQRKLDELREAFDNADTDGNGKLTEQPFKQFVQLGFKKPCPDGMYGYLCDHFAVPKSEGLSWDNALQIWKQSNPPPKGADNLKARTPNPKKINTGSSIGGINGNNDNSKSPLSPAGASGAGSGSDTQQPSISSMGRSQTERVRGSRLGDDGNLTSNDNAHRTRSPSPAGDRVTANHRRDTSLSGSMRRRGNGSYRDLSSTANAAIQNTTSPNNIGSDNPGHSRVLSGSLDSDLSDASVDFSRSTSLRGHQKRESSLRRTKTMLGPTLDRRQSNNASLGGGDDASSMVVQMIEQKLKNATSQLKDEKKKRKKADETTQQLLLQNEKLKQKLSETESKCKKLEKDLRKASDEGKKFKGVVEDDRNTMTHLKAQLKSAKEERDEAFKLLRKMEEQHDQHLSKLKKKHTDEMEKQSNGFLQTLGVDPSSGKGVREVIGELKESNISLNEQVDMLAETLARKEASLIHALQVLDEMSQPSRRGSTVGLDDSKQELQTAIKLSKRASIAENFKNNVIQGLAKNKQAQINGTNSTTTGTAGTNKAKSPLPAPPVNRRKFSNPKPMHNADFYRHASSPRYYGNINPVGVQFHKNSRLNKGKNGGDIQGSTKTKEKSMEMLNNSLVSDVVNKQDAIDQLKTANNTLVDQVMNLQHQLDDMHRTSQIFMKKNDMRPNSKKDISTIKEERNGNMNGTIATNNNKKKKNQNNSNTSNNNKNKKDLNNNESNRSRASTHSRESEDLP